MDKFTKQDSKSLKAIAVILMLVHHCFRNPQTLIEYKVVTIIGLNNLTYLADFCKICVSIFAFVSGYGLFLVFNKMYENHEYSLKNILKQVGIRYIKLMRDYWFVTLASYVILQFFLGKTYTCFFDGKTLLEGTFQIILNFLGFDDMVGFSNDFNGAWWYMSFAILLVVFAPIVAILIKKSRLSIILLFLFVIIFPRLFLIRDNATTHYYQFTFIYVLGAYCAHTNLLGRIKKLFFHIDNSYLKRMVLFILMTLVMIISYELRSVLSFKYYFDIVWGIVPFVFILYMYLYFLPYVYKIGDFIGNYSTYIFLIHLFVKNDFLYDFIYSLKFPIIILLILLIICIFISVILNWLRCIVHYDTFVDRMIIKIQQL